MQDLVTPKNMKILTVSGSSRALSTNAQLLDALPVLFPEKSWERFLAIDQLPLFRPEDDRFPWHGQVLEWRKAVTTAQAIIFCTPEYIHNLPAIIKNALEWLTSSGELQGKPVLVITYTPHEPRGEKAMQSLIWSLQALEARIVGQLPLYQNEIKIKDGHLDTDAEMLEILREAISLL